MIHSTPEVRRTRTGSERHRDAGARQRYVLLPVGRTWWTSLNHTANCKPSQASAAVPQLYQYEYQVDYMRCIWGSYVRVQLVANAKYFAPYFLIVLLRQIRYYYLLPCRG